MVIRTAERNDSCSDQKRSDNAILIHFYSEFKQVQNELWQALGHLCIIVYINDHKKIRKGTVILKPQT